jgi:D-arabinose 1-dehydrogenase-like Zn-dependent alcohol dehydrogenase
MSAFSNLVTAAMPAPERLTRRAYRHLRGNGAKSHRPAVFIFFGNSLDVLGTSMESPADFTAMLALVAEGKLKPAVDDFVAMDDAVSAAEKMNASTQCGKIVMAIA